MTGPADDMGLHRSDAQQSSIDGAHAIGPYVGVQRHNIRQLYEQHGPLIDEELWAKYKEAYGEGIEFGTLKARRRELVQLQEVRDSGVQRINPKSNVKCIVWELGVPDPEPQKVCPHCGEPI